MRWWCAITAPVAAAEKQGVRMRSADVMEQTANDSETEISFGKAEEQNPSLPSNFTWVCHQKQEDFRMFTGSHQAHRFN